MPETYHEPELIKPINLCDQNGGLNSEAVGWSRRPLHFCNLQGHWPRKKRWNYWAIVSPTHLFSVTLSDVDYLGLPFLYILEFESQDYAEKTLLKPFGAGIHLPPEVNGNVVYEGSAMPITMQSVGNGVHLKVRCPDLEGKPLKADLFVHQPQEHETLNVVIPWSKERFQFTSKQNCLPTEGTITWGEKRIEFPAQTPSPVWTLGAASGRLIPFGTGPVSPPACQTVALWASTWVLAGRMAPA